MIGFLDRLTDRLRSDDGQSASFHQKTPVYRVRVGERSRSGAFLVRWMKLVDRNENDPFELIVPIEHPAYSSEMEAVLDSLETDDRMRMQFTTINPRRTKLVCSKVATLEGDVLAEQSIDYRTA